MSTETALSKGYEPAAVERHWYDRWVSEGAFTADPARVTDERPAYSIVIPPPNVTGVLTLGHVLNNTLQDILARRARMLGREVLWLPGTDHAGIATQNVVEKTLRKEGVIRHRDDLGREKLVEKIWEWKERYGGIILTQLRALGCSCDWSRTRFTMDDAYSRCVQDVFVDLYRKGLIYRGKRMVNWCPASLTALSDEEVEMKPQQGVLYHFRVEVVESPGTWLTIATTRPETIPGDTAVAVNPHDPRYAALIGKHVRRPLPREDQAQLPIIADEQVAFDFGTGVLKVTPAHDKADFEIGLRHHLPQIDIMHPHGVMNDQAGRDLAGLERFKARERAVELLKEAGALDREEPYQNSVGYSERAQVPIEPRLSEQWFLKYPSAEAARAVVADGRMRFHPERWAKVYDHWMSGLQDWCISRQLWWGHRIPVWYRGERGAEVETRCQIESPGDGWVQDPDVLDTWFSSWLWPFATMGWPERTDTLRKFYPTGDLVTGPDIIFFWVARMIMAGFEYTGELPFRNVYFTGIIRDKQGRKMSKSLGNSPDPLDIIAKYGADGLRFGLMRIAPQGQDIRFDEQQIVEGRNFCNKLWNACRFRLMQGPADPGADPAGHDLSVFARRLLARWDETLHAVNAAYDGYRFSEIAQRLYDFVWGDFCDWFVEMAKSDFATPGPRRDGTLATLDYVLRRVLLALHPFTPFVTEELWHALGFGTGFLDGEAWPESDGWADRFAAEAVAGSRFCDAVTAARNLRAAFNLPSNRRLVWRVRPTEDWVRGELPVLGTLLNAERVDLVESGTLPEGEPSVLTPIGDIVLPIDGVVDVVAERKRIGAQLEKTRKDLAATEAKLANPDFVQKVPAAVLEEHRLRGETLAALAAELESRLGRLG